MMTAMCAARNIMGANYDLWAINSEPDFHEEKQGDGPALSEKYPPSGTCGSFTGTGGSRALWRSIFGGGFRRKPELMSSFCQCTLVKSGVVLCESRF
jgi:hypothetical protein